MTNGVEKANKVIFVCLLFMLIYYGMVWLWVGGGNVYN